MKPTQDSQAPSQKNLWAIIVAAGESRRFNQDTQGPDAPNPRSTPNASDPQNANDAPQLKQLLQINGRPMFAISVDAFHQVPDIKGIVVVLPERTANMWNAWQRLWPGHSPQLFFVTGGSSRGGSVQNGLTEIPSSATHVAIHDGVRPGITPKLINSIFEAALTHGAAVPALKLTDTVKRKLDEKIAGPIETLDRSTLYTVQTPQIFRHDWLKQATLDSPPSSGDTDDASVLEKAGYPIALVPGDPGNIKITTLKDWENFCETTSQAE